MNTYYAVKVWSDAEKNLETIGVYTTLEAANAKGTALVNETGIPCVISYGPLLTIVDSELISAELDARRHGGNGLLSEVTPDDLYVSFTPCREAEQDDVIALLADGASGGAFQGSNVYGVLAYVFARIGAEMEHGDLNFYRLTPSDITGIVEAAIEEGHIKFE